MVMRAPLVPLNLTWITPRLALGGRFAAEQAEVLARDLDIRAVVDLRVEDRDDEALLLRHGLAFLHLPTQDHDAVSLAMLDEGVTFVNRHLDRSERVLIHCEHGIGRSILLACCMLESRGDGPCAALERIKAVR